MYTIRMSRFPRQHVRRATDGLASDHTLGCGTGRRRRGAGCPPRRPCPPQDARPPVAPLRRHTGQGGRSRWTRSGHRPAVRDRLPRGRVGRPETVGRGRAGERPGRPHRGHPGVADLVPGPHRGRGVRTDRGPDGSPPSTDPGAGVPGRPGIPLAAGPGHPRPPKKTSRTTSPTRRPSSTRN